MRTHVTLDGIGALVEGRHERPLDVLGPHEVEVDGRKTSDMLSLRKALSGQRRGKVVDIVVLRDGQRLNFQATLQ